MTKHRPGSMGAAEAKTTRRFFIGATIIVLTLFLFTVTNNGTYFHLYYERANTLSKVLGWLFTGGWLYFLWFHSYDMGWGKKGSATRVAVILLLGLALAFGCLFGFRFDL